MLEPTYLYFLPLKAYYAYEIVLFFLLFLSSKLHNIYSLIIESMIMHGFELILGVDSKVIHLNLNNCKSFLLNA
jgi:hypothetical protein